MCTSNKFKSNREQVLEQGVWAVQYAKSKGYEVEFFAEDAGRADLAFLAQMVQAVIEAGADVVNIPDTTGYCLPHLYGKRINYLFENVKVSARQLFLFTATMIWVLLQLIQ